MFLEKGVPLGTQELLDEMANLVSLGCKDHLENKDA